MITNSKNEDYNNILSKIVDAGFLIKTIGKEQKQVLLQKGNVKVLVTNLGDE